ncbi:YveK family protein [Sporosarcina psychrophila]|uniref:YveK family protein n=1 Tax=Sporosarcina psychrophila TaxID=1476 RepID=UPI00078C1363|nr:Wzz/FepE/Etk N-terminal domain-containing protein [Sporosarcina psychrophila]AMQ07897.1 capsular biosynthesis protein [Sporosarcina psychrophila]
MEETISLQDLIKTLRKRLILIIFAIILAVTIAGIVSYFFLTPIYQASTQILVNQEKSEQQQFNSQDIQTNLQLINTYNVIIKSPAILSKVIGNLDLNTTPAQLNSKVTVNSAQNSQVLNISVQDPEPHVAVDIANTTAEVFQEEIQKLMNVDNVNVLSPAVHVENPSPIKPNPKLNMAIAAVIGLMLGVGIAFLLEYLDTTVKTEQDIEELLGLPILGLISPITETDVPGAKGFLKQRRKKR